MKALGQIAYEARFCANGNSIGAEAAGHWATESTETREDHERMALAVQHACFERLLLELQRRFGEGKK
jgi:hypothetical protein